MSVRSITNGELTLNNLNVSTINGSAYPPVSGAGTLADVLLTGNSAGTQDINMNTNDITNVGNINVATINGSAYPSAGTLIYGSGTTGNFNLTSGLAQIIDTITLPIGVWSVQMSEYVVAGGGVIDQIAGLIYTPSSPNNYYYYNNTLLPSTTTYPSTGGYNFTNNVVLKVTTPTTYTYAIEAYFFAPAVVQVLFPSLSLIPAHYLVATQLA